MVTLLDTLFDDPGITRPGERPPHRGVTAGRRARPSADAGTHNDLVGLYGPGSEAWRLNREAVILLGAGPRALLLQIAHPLVAEGVDQHSAFRSDPWARLSATLRSYLRIVYGNRAVAQAEIGRLNRLHRTISGPVRDPAATQTTGAATYQARDPSLSLWVHATLVDSTIVAYDAWIEPLTAARRAAFYAETRPIARAFGIPDDLLPPDYDSFASYIEEMIGPAGPVHPTPTARELAAFVLRPPLAPLVGALPSISPVTAARAGSLLRRLPPGAYAWALWPAVALLPSSVRRDFGLAWSPVHRLVASSLCAGFRAWRPLLPRIWRQMPQAVAADRRVADRLVADRRAADRPAGILRR